MDTAKRKRDVALFADSVELNDITETLVFSDPYFDAGRNHQTKGLGPIVARLRVDVDLKVEGVWQSFTAEFSTLWRSERTGILYEESAYEGQPLASEQALSQHFGVIWQDALDFALVELIRRTLSLAHIAENDSIEDEAWRTACEARGLDMGRQLVVNRARMGDISQVNDLAKQINKGANL